MSRNKILVVIVGLALAIALIASVTAYVKLRPKRLKDPAMAKWLQYFQVDVKTRTHPFKILRIVEGKEPKEFSAEIPFSYDFLMKERWGSLEARRGKFALVVNGDTVSSDWDRGTNGNCIFRFDASDLAPGTNQVRLDILVNNRFNIHGWILAKGPSTELVITNNFR